MHGGFFVLPCPKFVLTFPKFGCEIHKTVTAFAAKSVDGKKGKLLVTDLFGRDSAISVQLKGASPIKNVKAVVLSFEKNLESVPVSVKNGTFTLRKPDAYSSAFLISFDL